MANGNITIKGKTSGTTVGSLSVSGTGALSFLQVLYQYANLTLPYNPNDPGLVFTYDYPTISGVGNPCSGLTTSIAPVPVLYANFFNLLNEPSTLVPVNISAGLTTNLLSGIGVECLDVRIFGAVGDGVTDDTAAIQAALDLAWQNYLALQSADAQNTPVPAGTGPTRVCIPSGLTCLISGALWRGACGTTWPNKPTTGQPYDAILFIRTGVTLQLDGTIITAKDTGAGTFTSAIAFFDNTIADGHVTNASIVGTGTVDGNSSAYGFGSTVGFGAGIYAIVSQGSNLIIDGITVQNCFGQGIIVIDATNPTSEYPQEASIGVAILPVPTTTIVSSASITNCRTINCGKVVNGVNTDAQAAGGIFVYGYGITVDTCVLQSCSVGAALYLAGATIVVQNCTFTGNTGFDNIFVDRSLGVQILGNTFTGNNNSTSGIETRASKVQQPTTLIDWIDTLTIVDNQISTMKTGMNFPSSGVIQPVTPWYRYTITNNTVQNCANRGIAFGGLSRAANEFQGVIISHNNYANNTPANLGLPDGDNLTATFFPYTGLSVNEPQLFTQVLTNGLLRNYGAQSETPAGTVNGVNKVFTISQAPNPVASLQVWGDGVFLIAGTGYTLSGGNQTITYATAPTTSVAASYNF